MKYIVKTPIKHDGADYKPGQVIDLTPAQAEAMPWAVEPAAQKREDKKPGE